MKKKKILFQLISFVISLLPIVIYLLMNYDYYFETIEKGYGVGIFLVVIFLMFAMKDKAADIFKNNAQLKISILLLMVFWGLNEIAEEAIILSFLSFIGSVLSIPFAVVSKKYGKKQKEVRQIEITKEALYGVIEIAKKE